MTHRYSLRFETGERRGETVPIAAARFTIGRKPGSSLQIIEASVSGTHAELSTTATGVLLRDLGSTNGTRVGQERVMESPLIHGAQFFIGNIGLTFLDGSVAPPAGAPAPAPARSSTIELPDDVLGDLPEDGPQDPLLAAAGDTGASGFDVSDADLERARSGSRAGLLLVIAMGALAGAAGWYFTKGAGAGETVSVLPVVPVPGNLLAGGFSFEESQGAGPAVPWASRDGAPSGFLTTASAAVSGAAGLEANLESGAWALHESDQVRVQAGRLLRFGAALSSESPAIARIGLELSSPLDEDDEPGSRPGPMTVWSAPVETAAVETLAIQAAVPGGYKRARLLILGSAPGELRELAVDADSNEQELPVSAVTRVQADDAWLAPQTGGGPSETLDEFKFFSLGEPATVAALYRVDDALVTGLRVRDSDAGMGLGIGKLQSSPVENGIGIESRGVSGKGTLLLRAERAATAGGIATIGSEGYLRHSVEFERAGVTDLLLGSGLNLVRFRFPDPVQIKGRPMGRAFQLSCELPQAGSFMLQLKFRSELDAAASLARDAELAEDDGKLGVCLAKWQELLDEYPYDERHVSRAEETRSRLIVKGLEEAREIAAEVERARFFRLIDLYRQCLARSQDLARRFGGSEVEPEALRMAAEVQTEIAALEVDLDQFEKARLERIAKTLAASGASGLASEVERYVAERFGEGN